MLKINNKFRQHRSKEKFDKSKADQISKDINLKTISKLSWNLRCILCLVPSFIGIVVFFLLPFIRVLYYSIISDQFHKRIVWFDNYKEILSNSYFQLALKNSVLLILIGVPLLIISSVILSLLLSFHLNKLPPLKDAFIFPMLVPTAGIVLIWQQLFAGYTSAIPVYLLFLWKNLGICIILLTAALTTLDKDVFEAARIDGAKELLLHCKITIPLIVPTIFFTTLLAIVNSFKIFKESYLYYGNKYPPDHSYTLQFYMNNNFLKFDYQSLASSSILTSVIVLIIVAFGLMIQRRFRS